MGLVHQLLMLAERRWQRLHAPALVAEVVAGAKYRDGEKVKAAEAKS